MLSQPVSHVSQHELHTAVHQAGLTQPQPQHILTLGAVTPHEGLTLGLLRGVRYIGMLGPGYSSNSPGGMSAPGTINLTNWSAWCWEEGGRDAICILDVLN